MARGLAELKSFASTLFHSPAAPADTSVTCSIDGAPPMQTVEPVTLRPRAEGGEVLSFVQEGALMGVSNMFHRNMLLGGAVLWLTACGAPLVGQAVLKTDQERYAPGSELMLQLQNESLQPLGYNLCFASLQRQVEGTWTAVPRPDHTYCPAYLAYLPPGQSSEELRPLEETLPEGTYRYVLSVSWDEEHQEVVSNAFSVARAD